MGKLAYYLEGAAELPKQFGKSWKMRFATDDKTIEEEVLLFMIANSQSVGGFREIAPLASVSDGLFDAVIIKKMDIFQMLPLMISILQGDHVNHPAVEYIQTKKTSDREFVWRGSKSRLRWRRITGRFPGKYQYHSTGNTNRGTGKINTNLRD